MASHRLSTGSLKPDTARSRPNRSEHRRVRMDLPERFKCDGDDGEEDAGKLAEDKPEAYMQQSVYGVIAAAQRQGNFTSNIQPDSGSDSEPEGEEAIRRSSKEASRTVSAESSRRSSLEERRNRPDRPEGSHQRKSKMSENKLLRSFLKPIHERGGSRAGSSADDQMTQSQILRPKESAGGQIDRPSSAGVPTDAPVMDRRLQAKAKADMESSSAASSVRRSGESTPPAGSSRRKAPVALPEALAEIFSFDEPEDVIAEYACWYLQSVLLQGYMYVTQKHVCFYAYLQKKGNVTIKSGHLAKQGKRNPRYRRYWFTLKGDVLSYFTSAAEPYFPNGTIDLRYGVGADIVPEKGQEKDDETATFTITTEARTYCFRADSASSAKEWVRQLQKVIFRSHNDGDSVKISLPIENIVDVEQNPVIDSAETIKLRVMDNDETYAVDEYFFTFFKGGEDALNVLKLMTQDTDARKLAMEMEHTILSPKGKSPMSGRSSTDRSPRLSPSRTDDAEPVRSTLTPFPDPWRLSPKATRHRSRSSSQDSTISSESRQGGTGRGRRSFSGGSQASMQRRRASNSPTSPSAQASTESFVTSSERAGSPPSAADGTEDEMSASRVLGGDAAFRAPKHAQTDPGSRRPPVNAPTAPRDIVVQPPSRTQTQQLLSDSRPDSETDLDASRRASGEHPRESVEYTRPTRPTRAIATPLQHAFTLAGGVLQQGKRMSSYLGSSPKSYYDKFSDAIAGGKRHYTDAGGLTSEDRVADPEDDLDTAEHERRFQQHFALPETEKLHAVYYCWLHRVLPLYGKIYMSDRRFCFRSLLYGTRTKLVVPFRDIDNVNKEKGFRLRYPGMVLVIKGHEELFFDFSANGLRDDCVVTILRGLDVTKTAMESIILTAEEKTEAEAAAAENELLQDAQGEHDHSLPDDIDRRLTGAPPVLFDDPSASMLDFKPKESLRITCLTIGSRGDVQPYIALCKGLIAQGHQAKIATHKGFEAWIRKHGIEFAPVEGDPAELMRTCVENGMFTPSFVYETNSKFRGWLDELLVSSWKACQNSDLLIESPSAMSGIHIAEALGIPYFRAFGMPWTKTRAYPHAFAVPNRKMGGQYNYMTYVFFDNMFWQMTAGQINRWRRKTLNLNPTDLGKLQPNKVPFLYNFSPSVVVPPLDFSDWIRVTGYWFLDEPAYTPPPELLAFMEKARADKMKLVYIGFGSVPVSDTAKLTQNIVDAVLTADVRCILSKGWSDHFTKSDPANPVASLPPAIFQINSAPHDWLFKRIDAAVHHGGAGTTGASLRAGVPTIIKPFFGDQFFFATRVEDLGVGCFLKKITGHALGKALWVATHDERIRTKARGLGERIRAEDGVGRAVDFLWRDLEYARSLVKRREVVREEGGEEGDESWTFVEGDSDVDAAKARGEQAQGQDGSGDDDDDDDGDRRSSVVSKDATGS